MQNHFLTKRIFFLGVNENNKNSVNKSFELDIHINLFISKLRENI